MIRTEVGEHHPTVSIAWVTRGSFLTSRYTLHSVATDPPCDVMLSGRLSAQTVQALPKRTVAQCLLPGRAGPPHVLLVLEVPRVTLLLRVPGHGGAPVPEAYWHGDATPAATSIARKQGGGGSIPVPGPLENTWEIPVPM